MSNNRNPALTSASIPNNSCSLSQTSTLKPPFISGSFLRLHLGHGVDTGTSCVQCSGGFWTVYGSMSVDLKKLHVLLRPRLSIADFPVGYFKFAVW